MCHEGQRVWRVSSQPESKAADSTDSHFSQRGHTEQKSSFQLPHRIKWKPEDHLSSMAHDHSPSREDTVGVLNFKSPQKQQSRGGQTLVPISLGASLPCPAIGCCSTVLVVALLPEDHCCSRNNRKPERKHTPSLESKNVITHTPEYTQFLPSLAGRTFFCSCL